MRSLRRLFPHLFAGLLILAGPVSAEVTLAPLFQDHAVLQRGQPVSIWGSAAPGEAVRLRYRDWTADTTAGADGRWLAMLGPLTVGPAGELICAGRDNTLTRTDVVVGDVWLCSGQSNMQFPVRDALNARTEIAAAAEVADIRQFRVAFATASEPAVTVRGDWRRASPDTVGDFTAVGYFFAREYQRKTGVPVGLINASVGATAVESWIAATTLRADAHFSPALARWQEVLATYPARRADYEAQLATWERASGRERLELARHGTRKPALPIGPGHRNEPGSLFHAMIAPLAGYGLRGVLWYQGEANVTRTAEYAGLFTTLIRDWRQHWAEPELPFYFVQLAGHADPQPGADWPRLREAQASALALPATGMVTAIALGEAKDIHPLNKQDVGRRLAALALARLEGVSGPTAGPVFQGIEPAVPGSLRVRFTTANRALVARGAVLSGFGLAEADPQFDPA